MTPHFKFSSDPIERYRRTDRRSSRTGFTLPRILVDIVLMAAAGCMANFLVLMILTPVSPAASSPPDLFDQSIRRLWATSQNKLWIQRGLNEISQIDTSDLTSQRNVEWKDRTVTRLQVSHDGRTCLLVMEESEVIILRDRSPVFRETQPKHHSVQTAISRNGSIFVRANEDGLFLCLEFTDDSYVLREFPFLEQPERISLDDSGIHLAVATTSGNLQIYNIKAEHLDQFITTAVRLTVAPLFTRDGTGLILASQNHISLMNWKTKDLVWKIDLNESEVIRDIALSPDGEWIAASGISSTVNLLQSQTGDLKRTYELPQNFCWATFAASSDEIFIGDEKGTVSVWSIHHEQRIREIAFP